MYRYTPDEVDYRRAHHQGRIQGEKGSGLDAKRIGNLGEIAFEWFCRQYIPAEFWSWNNAEAIRRCNTESYASNDFTVFDFDVDVKTSRDVSAFLPESIVKNDDEDDIIVMVWHRDNEDSLIILGWAFMDTLESKMAAESQYSGDGVPKLDHLSMRPMNEFVDLGPNAMNLNQMPDNPFSPGDRVKKKDGDNVGVVTEVVPPDEDVNLYGKTMTGEAVNVTFPNLLDDGPGDWREIHPALLASYCSDQDVKCYTYKSSNLEFAEPSYLPGDIVLHTGHDDPDDAMVIGVDDEVKIVFEGQVEDDVGSITDVSLAVIEGLDESTYSYAPSKLEIVPQYDETLST